MLQELTSHATTIFLAAGVAACYPRSVNKNIFHIIGVIVVIVVVLKVLGVFWLNATYTSRRVNRCARVTGAVHKFVCFYICRFRDL